jgi:transposase
MYVILVWKACIGSMRIEFAHRRHDITDRVWSILEPHLPGKKGDWGGIAADNRLFINAVFWILRTGAPWRDLPPDYGDWKNIHRRFSRWRDRGIWEKLLELLIDDVDYEWLMIDSTFIKVHQQGTGAAGGNQSMSVSKGGSTRRYIWPWMRMVCRSELLSLKVPQLIVLKLRNS